MAAHADLPLLTTERLTLNMLDARCANEVAEYFARNREFMRPWNPLVPEAFFTPAWQAERLEQDLAEFAAGRMARFWLLLREDDGAKHVVGHVAFSNIIRGALQGCHLGYMIDKAHGGRGLITEAVRRIVFYGFDDLGLHRIEANIMPHNARSIRVAEKVGFQHEGLSPRYLKINGVWEDHYRYGLLNPAE